MTNGTKPNGDPELDEPILTDIITDPSTNIIAATDTTLTTQPNEIAIDNNYSLILSDEVIEIMFQKIDTNNDGVIDLSELKTYLALTDNNHLPKGFAREVLRRADKNDDKAISKDEFLKLCHNDGWLTNQTFLNFCEIVTLPIRNRQKRVRYEDLMSMIPFFIIIISLLQIIFFINDQRSVWRQRTAYNATDNNFDPNFSTISQYLIFRGNKMIQIWRFFTYMLVHENISHIASNLFLQLISGIPLESVHGWWRILILYLASVLAGSIGVESISNCNALVGSSAGAYGLLGAHFSTLIMNWKEMDHKFIRLLLVGVYVVVDVVICLNLSINGFTNSTITHLCGFLIGFLVGNVTIKNLVSEDYEKTIWLVSSISVGLLFTTGIFLIIFIPN